MPSNWLYKILNHQVTPPQGVWKNITRQLDKDENNAANDVKTKLLAFETAPPKNVLTNIFNALDKDEEQVSFKDKMYHFQQDAPPKAWQNIISELQKEETKIVSLKDNKKNPKVIFFRMAAAASVIAIITTAIFLVTRNSAKDANNLTASVTPQSKQQKTFDAAAEKTTLPASATQEKKLPSNNFVNPKVKKATPFTEEKIFATDYLQGNQPEDFALNPANEKVEKLQTVSGETPMDIALMNTPNAYISITGPDGQPLKVSAKFSSVINFLNDRSPEAQENIDVIIKESAKWKATFAKWREKMTNNMVAPSLYNFMDIIELSDVLEEKK